MSREQARKLIPMLAVIVMYASSPKQAQEFAVSVQNLLRGIDLQKPVDEYVWVNADSESVSQEIDGALARRAREVQSQGVRVRLIFVAQGEAGEESLRRVLDRKAPKGEIGVMRGRDYRTVWDLLMASHHLRNHSLADLFSRASVRSNVFQIHEDAMPPVGFFSLPEGPLPGELRADIERLQREFLVYLINRTMDRAFQIEASRLGDFEVHRAALTAA